MTMPIFIRQLSVQWVIFVERAVPHCRPQVIGLQPKQQLKNALVEKMIEAAVFLVHPIRERGRFIVDKNSAILYGGLALDISSGFDV